MSPNAIKPIPYKANIPVEINRNNQIAIAMIIGNGYNFILHGKNVLPFLFLNNINPIPPPTNCTNALIATIAVIISLILNSKLKIKATEHKIINDI